MASVCPITYKSIDGTVSRLNALSVSILLIAFVVTQEMVLLFVLGIDFVIRVYGNKRFSPIFHISSFIKKVFNMKTVTVDSGAKRLAAQFGIAFVFLLIVSTFFNLILVSYIISAIFLLCTALEFFFAFCVGCEVYFLFQKWH